LIFERKERFSNRTPSMSDTQQIFVDDAGLVLAAPFLPRFFDMLGLLAAREEGTQSFRSDEAARRAVHLLRFVVDGISPVTGKLLTLERVLCGVSPDAPIGAEVVVSDQEREICETMLKAIIANWPIISHTSIAGLRETFLQREGRLEPGGERQTLHVQRKTVDVLVDQIPWSFSVILHHWMPRPLYVTW
jgi:hypothetical protein